ncbi:FMRFamide receptor-like [Argopecten irradians]|uniref:FMRFamide receptor-like n=1 Tax=Argopecten irradians TaxID=31199 RepID=UPI00371EBFBB
MGVSETNFALNLSYGGKYIQDTGNSTDQLDAFYMQYMCNGIALPIISVLGVIGNILTMMVLWRKEMQSTTILFLCALVLTDTGIIIVACVALTPYSISLFHPELWYYKDVIYPNLYTPVFFLIMSIQQCNVWITVSVSVERYIAICHPFRAQKICTRKKTYITLIVITVTSIAYNIPRLFATMAHKPCPEPGPEIPIGHDCYTLVTTDFGNTLFYTKVYSVWMYASIIYIIPLSVLTILNILIIMELMRMRARRAGMNIQDDQEANLSLVLVLIVVVFILCQTPGLFAQFDFLFTTVMMIKWLAVSNILFVANSSVNFLIYTLVGQKFRRVLLGVLKNMFGRKVLSDVSRNSSRQSNGLELNHRQYAPVNSETHVENVEKIRLND